jgi:small subunit ribosomal protein S10
LKSFDYRLVDQSAIETVETAKRSGVWVVGPVPVPVSVSLSTRRERFTVNRSPHVHRKAMDQFELSEHDRLIDIHGTTADTIDALKRLNLPAGVEILIDI